MNLTEHVDEGDALRVRDAYGEWHDAVAASAVENGRDFPIVWVQFGSDGLRSERCRIPWPVEAVEFANAEGVGPAERNEPEERR